MGLLEIFSVPADTSLLAIGTYEPSLVALSVAISIFASLMALHIAGQATAATNRSTRTIALLLGTLALGAGIWAMHFIGMLAFNLCTQVSYDRAITIGSMLPSLAASFIALSLISRPRIGAAKVLLGGVLVGAGIGGMHYTGMAAMELQLAQRYDVGMFALSILVAVVLAVLALWVRFGLVNFATRLSARDRLLLSAVVMGSAISGMHYTAMAAARFVGHVHGTVGGTANADFIALAVALTTVLLTVIVLAANGLIRYRAMVRNLSEKESRLRTVLATATDGVITMDASGAIQEFNASAERIFGWPRSEVIGRNVAELMADAGPAGALDPAQSDSRCPAGSDMAGSGERLGLRKDGSSVAIRLAIGHTRVADQDQCVAFVTDISERKAIEQALRDSEEQFRSLIGNIPGIAYRALVAPDLPLVFVSDAIAELTGLPSADFRDPLAGRALRTLIHPEDRDSVAAEIAGAIEAGRSFLVEFRLAHQDGSTRWMWCNGNVVRNDAGKAIWLDGVILDISERHRMEEQLRDAKERAEQAAAARTAFMANMSHEIRTPMNSILGFTDVLLQSKLESDQRRYLETVRSSGRSLLRLLNEILDTAKLDKGAVELELADFDLLRLIDELSSTMGANARAKGIALNIRYDKDLPHCFKGDELRVRQILTNLISNAIKFTEVGSVTLSVEPMQSTVHFAIADTGIGIDADRLEAIFDPFTQADVSMSRRFGGTGLGTTISKQLVELMGGRIWVQSVPRLGSTFHVQVPLAAAEQRPQLARLPRNSVVLPPLRILIADDVPQNLELLTLLLGKQGHVIVTADDGARVLEAAAQAEFDVILMDMQMPGIDGPDACRRIRAAEVWRGSKRVPVIALTASVLEADRQVARESGMDGFASKPIDLYELTAEIARVLGIEFHRPIAAGPVAEESRVLDRARGLACWAGEREAYHRGLRRFAVEQADAAKALHLLYSARDHAGLRALAHRVKGLAGNLGLQRLAAVLDHIERAVTSHRDDGLADFLSQASSQLEGALQAIRKEIGPDVPVNTSLAARPIDIERLRTLGAGLMSSLGRGALDDKALADFTTMLGGHVDATRLAELCDCIEDFNFDSARAIVAAMLESCCEAGDWLQRT